MLKKIAKNFWTLGLIAVAVILLPQGALAADSLINSGIGFHPVPGDLSVTFLRKIFGVISGTTLSDSRTVGNGTIFGEVFYVFNSGLLMLVGITLFYTICRSIIEIAHANIGQAQGKFSWWQPVRVILGVGMLVPQSTGYSALNTLVMWIVIQGVGLADNVWTRAVDYIANGGVLYGEVIKNVPDKGIDLNLIDPLEPQKGGVSVAGAADTLRSHVCMRYLYETVEQYRKSQEKEVKNNPRNYTAEQIKALHLPTPVFREGYTHGKGVLPQLIFPANADDVISPHTDEKTTNLNGICGTYDWHRVPGVAEGGDQSGPEMYGAMKEMGFRNMVSLTASAAAAAVNSPKKSTIEFEQSLHDQAMTALVEAAANYQMTIASARAYAGNGYKKKDVEKFNVNDLTQDGWIAAGYLYFKLAKTQQEFVDNTYYPPAQGGPVPKCSYSNGNPNCNEGYTNVAGRMQEYINASGSDAVKYDVFLKDRLLWEVGRVDHIIVGIYTRAVEFAGSLNAKERCGRVSSVPQELQSFISKRETSLDLTSPATLAVYLPVGGEWYFGAFDGTLSRVFDFVNDVVRNTAGTLQNFVVFFPLNTALDNIFEKWLVIFHPETTEGGLIFPIIALQKLGLTMIRECFDFWQNVFTALTQNLNNAFAAEALAGGAGAIAGFIPGWAGPFQIIMTMIEQFVHVYLEIPLLIMLPIGFAISALLMVNGVIFAYYVPLLPFMLFLFGVISWLMFVIEGMVAAPLVALGVTHPEQHDLLGKAEQAVMLLLSLFIRPVAMVIGLLASMVLLAVAMEVLNAGFGKIIAETYYNNPADYPTYYMGYYQQFYKLHPSTALTQVRNVAMIFVYTLIVMALVKQCCSLIYALPNQIMSWIGGPHRPEEAQQLAEGVKGGLEHAAERVAGAVGFSQAVSMPRVPVQSSSYKQGADGDKDSSGTNQMSIENENAAQPAKGVGGGSTAAGSGAS